MDFASIFNRSFIATAVCHLCILLSVAPNVGCKRAASVPTTNTPATSPSSLSRSSSSESTHSPTQMPTGEQPQSASRPIDPVSRVLFTQVQDTLAFEHIFDRGAKGKLLEVETLGGGCGWIDYDMDGRMDILCNQGGDATIMDRISQPADGLFRNFGDRFQRIDMAACLEDRNFSQAIAVGDFDNDGFSDIHVSNVFANTLWKNCGDGTFLEVAELAGVADPRWSSTSAWADIDLDGDLDLYVCNYLVYDPTSAAPCYDDSGRLVLCNPSKLEPWPDACYINQGDGTFIEQSRELGLIGDGSRALSVAIADFNNDRLPDIYVANDTNDNFLFTNLGNGKFEERAKLLGCATDHLGMPQASMGLAINDFDRNGFLDIYATHYTQESNTLYENYGHGFQDVTGRMGLHQPTLAYLGFGTVMQDFDQNGEMELFVANGHVATAPHQAEPRMKPQLFSYTGNKQWRDVSRNSGPTFQEARLSRGVATADFDRDGDLDLLVLNLDDLAWLLRNDSERGAWLTMSFIGWESNRQGIGVRAEVTAGDKTYVQEVCGGTSFAAAHQPLLAFGFGEFEGELTIRVLWPQGKEQVLTAVLPRQHLVIRQPPSNP